MLKNGRNGIRGRLGTLLLPPLALGALIRGAPFHWGNAFIGEKSRLRLFMLKRYAWIEVRFLSVLYRILNLRHKYPILGKMWVRKLNYRLAGKFVGERMVAGKVMTLGEMHAFIDSLPEDSSIALGPCRCRLATNVCDHPLDTDIVILTGTSLWLDLFPEEYRVISKEEAKDKVRECYSLGLVPMLDRHMYYQGSTNYFVICNCCKCACLPIQGYLYYKGTPFRFIPSEYRSVVDKDKCEGCGKCVEICAFEERRLVDGKVEVLNCQGCGLCVEVCPHQANTMIKR